MNSTPSGEPTPTTGILIPQNEALKVIDSVAASSELSPEQLKKATELANRINIQDSNTITTFGVEVQRRTTSQAQQMIEQVKNKDTGPAGDALNDLVTQVRGLGADKLSEPGNPIQKMFYKLANPLAKFVQRYELVHHQIETVVRKLDANRQQLMRDVALLDNLYNASVEQFHELGLFIKAAEIKLVEWNTQVLPQLQEKARASGSPLDQQIAADAAATRDDLERKKSDLELTRMVTLQSLPSIRSVQSLDKALVNKIQTSIMTTIPIWEQQIGIAITLFRQKGALEVQKKATDTTNEMLKKNMELLRSNNAVGRKEIERGGVDIDTLKHTNEQLLGMIQETIQITQEGRQKRLQATQELLTIEENLKTGLAQASQKGF